MLSKPYRIRLFEEIDSTNTEAKKAAIAGEPEGLVILAKRQTAGRGRYGRKWESPEGNLYVSILLRPDCLLHEAEHYSFVTGLAIYDTLLSILPSSCKIKLKWPNDVLVNEKKISGILLEGSTGKNSKMEWLIIGIGINILHHPKNALYPATSILAESGKKLTAEVLLDNILFFFEKWNEVLSKDGFSVIRQTWLARAKTGKIIVQLPNETIEGFFIDLDERGHLILDLPNGSKRAIAAGDIFFQEREKQDAFGY